MSGNIFNGIIFTSTIQLSLIVAVPVLIFADFVLKCSLILINVTDLECQTVNLYFRIRVTMQFDLNGYTNLELPAYKTYFPYIV